MQHGKGHRKFGRVTKQRISMMKGLASQLIDHEKIKTTQTKAKELKPYIEKLITKGKNAKLDTRRRLIALLDKKTAGKLINELGTRFADRKGGYTRIRLMPPRLSDGSKMAVIELLKS